MDLQTAAERLGVHYQTAYRWVREGALRAVKRAGAYDIDEQELARFAAARATPVPPPRQAHVRSWDHQVERLYALLAVGDELGARQLVDRLREGGIDPVTLCERLMTPALEQIGDAWAAGDLSVAEEHRAAAVCERLLARIATHPRGRPRGIAVVATPAGEEHGLPASMAALALRADRWQVHHLGTQVPTPDLVDLVRTVGADLVVLSVTYPQAAGEADRLAGDVMSTTTARALVGAPNRTLNELLVRARAACER